MNIMAIHQYHFQRLLSYLLLIIVCMKHLKYYNNWRYAIIKESCKEKKALTLEEILANFTPYHNKLWIVRNGLHHCDNNYAWVIDKESQLTID